jgi:hypothetical protein
MSYSPSSVEFPVTLTPGTIEDAKLIPKMNSIADLESVSPYPRATKPFWQRIDSAVRYLPTEHRQAAYLLFSSVIYFGDRMVDDSWRFLLRELKREYGLDDENLLEDALVLPEDPANFKRFVHCNDIKGRLDTDKHPRLWGASDAVRDACLSKLLDSSPRVPRKLRKTKPSSILHFINRKYWILLYDYALSGRSLSSEISKTQNLAQSLNVDPKIVAIVQIMTEEAERLIRKECGSRSRLIYSVKLDERFKVNSPKCQLFEGNKNKNSLKSVRRLCTWFFQNLIRKDPEYENTLQLNRDMTYGFFNTGLTLVTPNCPSNSIPLLWYNRFGRYEGPYPRIESRITQTTRGDRYYLGLLRRLM